VLTRHLNASKLALENYVLVVVFETYGQCAVPV